MSIAFTWDIDLSTFIGRKIAVETIEGIKRIATLREVRFGPKVKIADRFVSIPIEIQFDDTSDVITFARIKSIQLHHDRG